LPSFLLTSEGPVNSDSCNVADVMASGLKGRSLPGRQITDACLLASRESSQLRAIPGEIHQMTQ
jgi:hypothetical protein